MVTENQTARRLSYLLGRALPHLLRDHNTPPAMHRINDDRDVQPLSVFLSRASALIDELQESRRPLVLTRGGQSAAVLIGAGEFERIVERLELLEDILAARGQARRGETVSHDEAMDYISDRLDADEPEAGENA